MTAPTAISDVSADLASVQARIAAISDMMGANAVNATGTSTAASDTTSFASALAKAATSPASTASTGSTSGSAVVADAKKYLGIPYVWGGESATGMDCSGLVQKTFGDLGITLPRTAAEQSHEGTAVSSLAQAKPGDLLFFGSPAYHVAIYAGDNKIIESPEPGKTVHETEIYQTPTTIRRIVTDSTATTASIGNNTGTTAARLEAAGLNPAVAAYADRFAATEQADHLPTGLLAAVAQQESGGNANAISPAGARGLMQLMPSTAAGLGVNPLDPDQAISAAGHILSRNLSRYNGSVSLALAAYNAGAGAVDKYGGIPPYSETQNYVRSITAMMAAGG
jgi:peptidoglycan DL-endopeptidase CwlO